MAFDEAMLTGCGTLGLPLLRFYSWREESASFGYFQKYRDIEALSGCENLIRRCTGGGLVSHVGDWTYSLAFPAGHERYCLSATDGYRLLHEAVATAFRKLGFEAWLAEECDGCGPGQCFVGHERHDVVGIDGKLAGAAQRRTRAGLLIQGSVSPPPTATRRDWEDAFREALGLPFLALAENDGKLANLRVQARRLAAEKYCREDYLRRR